MAEYYEIKGFDRTYNVSLAASRYQDNGALAIVMTCDTGEPYGVLTTNLSESRRLPPDEAFVDTNNSPWAKEFIEANKLGKPTGVVARSGWCSYPAYKFDMAKIPDALA